MTGSNRLEDFVGAEPLPRIGDDAAELALFRQFLARVEDACDDRDRLRYGPSGLVKQLSGTYDFIRTRKKREVLVRIEALDRDQNGVEDDLTLLEICLSDQPFIIDTIHLFLNFAGLRSISNLYTALPVTRDRSGRVTSFSSDGARVPRETLARFEIAARLDEDFRRSLEVALRERIDVSRVVVRDFKRMTTNLRGIARSYRKLSTETAEGLADARRLLEWLLDDNFILMGTSFYPTNGEDCPDPDQEKQLGHFRLSEEELSYCGSKISILVGSPPSEISAVVYKSQEESLIHRAGKIDNLLFRGFDEKGLPNGTFHVRGLFTFKAIQTPGDRIPMVRLKLANLIKADGCKPHSLRWKSITTAFNSIPVEFLFESPSHEISTMVHNILRVARDKELRSHVVVDRQERKGLYFLVIPREGYSEDLRNRIEAILIESLGATYSDSRVHIGKLDTVLLSFFFTAAERFRPFTREDLDEQVRSVAGSWEDRFHRALMEQLGAEGAQVPFDRYHRAFPQEYQLLSPPAEAVVDVKHLERIRNVPECNVAFEVFYGERDRLQRIARLRVYLRQNMYLSTILPMLDNFGLRIVDQSVFQVRLVNGEEMFVETFRVSGVDSPEHHLIAQKDAVREALEAVFEKRIGNDPLNRLTLELGIEWRDVDLLRSYFHYLRQLGVTYTIRFVVITFTQYPEVTRLLLSLYQARFSPDLDLPRAQRDERVAELAGRVRDELVQVRSSGQDHVIRLLLNLFESTLRTSRYRRFSTKDHSVAFKVDPARLMAGSEPRPWREIYVHHYGVEGVHLRGGKLARGGIRWSDRVSDFRDEILGLMRTQMVKNVLIVPVGAKGGFIVRKPVSDPTRRRQQADEMYRVFIHGLLDLTDNVVDGVVVPPDDVICYDEDDSYLVVAADKGTAHLSDTANEISRSRGFWLDDAFASGGSQGYDHKVLGITARGAWESVKRHFLEMGTDPARDTFTVVGIGDMSGDVFGNGMLLSRGIQLVGAFNHQHVFLDPNPSAAESFQERERLFSLPHSTWTDYDPAVLSAGGGVYDRQSKSISLEPETQRLLGLEGAEHSPEAVIRRLLTLEVDLLWNGGIGTYVKASSEDNRDVGDLANQDVRVSASEVHARVFAEGGNLGITQAGRVEYGLRGGRINADFVDNSAGVDCSDHEVNLKILLAGVNQGQGMALDERNELLRSLQDDVCRGVLRNNFDQCVMISLDHQRSCVDPFAYERTIKFLEDRGLLDRNRDCLPRLETVNQRHAEGRGLVRPELAMLGAHSKMEMCRRLLDLEGDRIPGLEDYLVTYFPTEVVERFGPQLSEHLLGRHIAVTLITNMIIDHAGSPFFFEVEREVGASVDRIVRAYLLADELFQGWGTKQRIIELGARVSTGSQYRALCATEEIVHRAVSWLLSGPELGRLDRIEQDRQQYREHLAQFEAEIPGGLADQMLAAYQSDLDTYYSAGFAKYAIGLPERVARFSLLAAGLRVVDICRLTDAPVDDAMRLYFQIGEISTILPLVRRCDTALFAGRWDSLALRIVRNSLLDSLWSLTHRQVSRIGPGSGREWVVDGLRELRAEPFLEELRIDVRNLGSEEISLAGLQVIASRLRSVCVI